MRNGVTLLIAQDPLEDGKKPVPRVRFVIRSAPPGTGRARAKLLSFHRKGARRPGRFEEKGRAFKSTLVCCTQGCENGNREKGKKCDGLFETVGRQKNQTSCCQGGPPAGNNPRPAQSRHRLPLARARPDCGCGCIGSALAISFSWRTNRHRPKAHSDRLRGHAKDLGSIKDAVAQMAADCGRAACACDHDAPACGSHLRLRHLRRHLQPDRRRTGSGCPGSNRDDQKAVAIQTHLTALASNLSLRLAARATLNRHLRHGGRHHRWHGCGGIVQPKGARRAPWRIEDEVEPELYAATRRNFLKTSSTLGFPLKFSAPRRHFVDHPDDQRERPISYRRPANGWEADEGDVFEDVPDRILSRGALQLYGADKVNKIKELINGIEPDVLAAQQGRHNTLNNQSLVVLFTFAGKTLLFIGDAQWGNWANFLFGGANGTPGHIAMTPSEGHSQQNRFLQGRPSRQHQRDSERRGRRYARPVASVCARRNSMPITRCHVSRSWMTLKTDTGATAAATRLPSAARQPTRMRGRYRRNSRRRRPESRSSITILNAAERSGAA